MTREDLQNKLIDLQAKERQAFANFNAILGARQFCESLIAEMAANEEGQEKEEKENLVAPHA